jgi:hypothetical protein
MNDKKKMEKLSQEETAPKKVWPVKWLFGLLAVFLLAVLFREKEPITVNEREGAVNLSSSVQSDLSFKIVRAEIVPPFPDLQSALKVELQAEGADRDPMTFRYRWLVNQKEAGNQPILPLTGFSQGDIISVEVTPSTEKATGASFRSPEVKIGNNPPAVTALHLLPQEPKAGEALRVEAKGFDKDNDSILYRYEWQINGQPVPGSDAQTLDGSFVHSADKIAVIVTPSDPFSAGPPASSSLLTVTNQSPKITSLPSGKTEENRYSYQVVAQDPDGDPLHYLLVSGPPGMTLDASGLLTWTAERLHEDKSEVTIEVNDAKGGKSLQQFTIRTK